MTDTQHTELMAMLAGLMRQGETLRDEVAELSCDLDDITGICVTLEALIHGVNMRFDEL
jgi:hypothetical protein